VNIKDFLKMYIKETPGKIIDIDTNETVGSHEGAVFYTIGQRHGLNVGGGLPYYIVKKDMAKNVIYVSKNLNSAELWTNTVKLEDVILRQADETQIKNGDKVSVRIRHRAPLIQATIKNFDQKSKTLELEFTEEIKMPATGQSAVIYTGKNAEICAGGGIIMV